MWQTTRFKRKYNLETKELQCTECLDILPFKNFYKSKKDFLGLSSKCRKCEKERSHVKWLNNHPEAHSIEIKTIDGITVQRSSGADIFINKELELKTCSKCDKLLHKSKFYTSYRGTFGTKARCKKCEGEILKKAGYSNTQVGIEKRIIKSLNVSMEKVIPGIPKDSLTCDKETLSLFYILRELEAEVAAELKKKTNIYVKDLVHINAAGKPHGKSLNYYTKK